MAQWPFVPKLDRRLICQGVHSAGTTTWTLPCSAVGMNRIVLSDAFGADVGKVLTPTSASGFTVTKTGDYSAGLVYIGRLFLMEVELSRVIRRDANQQPDMSSYLGLRFINAIYENSGDMTVRSKKPLRVDRTKAMPASSDASLLSGTLTAHLPGATKDTRLILESTSHKPVTIAGIELGCDLVGKLR